MTKVIHIIWSAKFGGIERLVYDLSHAQNTNEGLETAILMGKEEGEFLQLFQDSTSLLYCAKLSSGMDLSPLKCIALVNIFKEFDIIHFHVFNPLIALAAIIARKPILYTEHGNFGFGRKSTLRDKVNRNLLNYFLRYCVHFISYNSEFTRQTALKKYNLIKVPGSVFYNGIAFNNLKEPSSQNGINEAISTKLEGNFVVGTSSRFAGFKRIDRLMSAFSIFKKERKAVLLLVGDGVLRQELEQLALELGITESTVFTGFKQDVTKYQELMDVCVFPSKGEPFGLVAIETLALGKPTLVFRDGGGITEIIQKYSKTDIVGDIEALADRLTYYYQHTEELVDNNQHRQRFARKYDISEMEQKFFTAYKSIL